MDNLLRIDLIIYRDRYDKIYHPLYLIFFILFVFLYIIFTYQYEDYLYYNEKITNDSFMLDIAYTDLEYIKNNKIVLIDNKAYSYIVSDVIVKDGKIKLYLKVLNFKYTSEYIYELKILKSKKALVKYLF